MKISARAGQQFLDVHIVRDDGHYLVDVDGQRHVVDCHRLEANFYSILTGDRSYEVSVEPDGEDYRVRHGAAELTVSLTDPGRRAREGKAAAAGPLEIATQMPGKVVRLLVAQGDTVEAGQGVAVVEAMKMENEIAAPKAGKIIDIRVEPGQTVEGGAALLIIE